jgi:Ribonuclease G/E
MSATGAILVDGAIGETRQALVRPDKAGAGRVIALDVLRASDEGRRARWGETYAGRVRTVDRLRRGAFVDLGLKDDVGFLPLDAGGFARGADGGRVALKEGEPIAVAVTREAARAKGPALRLLQGAPPRAPARLARPEGDEEFARVKPASADVRARIDAAIEDALARRAPIPGGGTLTIEPTAALVAIDVDAGAREGVNDPERFALDLNIAAAQEAAQQVRLRGLGGIIAIDFVSLRRKSDRDALESAVKEAFADDPWGAQFGRLSRFGVYELARPQLRAPLHERLCDGDGRLSLETVALAALRAIEREANAAAGRRIIAALAPDIIAWLEAADLPWREALAGRIGPRFAIEAQPGAPRDRIDVRAV